MVEEDESNNGNLCGNCQFFCRRTKRPKKGMGVIYGQCRRFPPALTPFVFDDGSVDYSIGVPAGWAWPAVHSQQWCGEHKPKTGQTGQDK
jgi:hypothetical protein